MKIMTDKRALNNEALWSPVASSYFWNLKSRDVMLTSSRERDEKKIKYGQRWGGIRRRCRRMMWRKKQEKKVKELIKSDCNKNKKDQAKRLKNKCCISPEKTETQSDGNLILCTAEQIRGHEQQVLYSSSTHKKGERKTNFCVIERFETPGKERQVRWDAQVRKEVCNWVIEGH